MDQRPEFLKFMFEGEFEVFFSDQTFMKVGLSFGKDFGLVFGHTRSGQVLDEGAAIPAVRSSRPETQ